MLRSNYGMSREALYERTLAAAWCFVAKEEKIANNLNSILQGEGGGQNMQNWQQDGCVVKTLLMM